MDQRNRADIERRAMEVLRQHGLYSLPVDPVVLANRVGITVANAKLADESVAGLIVRRGARTMILVEQADPPYRKRFSIAHALGHYFLHLPGDGEIVDRRADMYRRTEPRGHVFDVQRMEIEANKFAAELLMPQEFVRKEWDRNPSIALMARVFNVSEEAMGYRVDALNLWVPTNER